MGVPAGPAVGENVFTNGTTAKVPGLEADPPAVVTVIFFPVTALTGTVAINWVSEITVKGAVLPPIVTLVVCVRLTPVMLTFEPTVPLGVKLLIPGKTRKARLLTIEPVKVVTVKVPVSAPDGTVAVI